MIIFAGSFLRNRSKGYKIMSKKFTTKELKKRAKAKRRRHQLKVNPRITGTYTLEQANKSVIDSLEAKLKASQD